MTNLRKLALCVMLSPALTFAAGSAVAQEAETSKDKDRPAATTGWDRAQTTTGQDRTQKATGQDRAQQASEQGRAQSAAGRDRAQEMAGQRMGSQPFLATKPARGLHADKLIGKDVKSASSGDAIGTISDLVIDERGQVVAVIVGVGGFLGMGQKDVAIGWEALTRKPDSDGGGYDYTINATKDGLKDAPEYKKS